MHARAAYAAAAFDAPPLRFIATILPYVDYHILIAVAAAVDADVA